MGRIFCSQADATAVTDLKGKKLSALLPDAEAPSLTWEELALYNWGTKEPAEVNRLLSEIVGVKTVHATDPSQTELDTDRGPGGAPKVLLPKLWAGANDLAAGKTHTIALKKRLPPPAVEILKCPRWSPPGKAFDLEYRLDGLVARASKVDFEVHVARYYDEDKNGTRTDSGTMGTAKGTTHVYAKRMQDLTGKLAPSAKQTYSTWKGETEATHGILKNTSTTKHVTHACAPYSVMVRYFLDDADKDTKLLLAPFFPRWDKKGDLVDASLTVAWEIEGAGKGKLVAGTLTLVDKDDKPVYAVALDEARVQKKTFDLLADATHKLDKTLITKALMPFRVQIQAHSGPDDAKGLAIATMHTAVKAMLYDEVQLIAFNIKPATKNGARYLGEEKDADDMAVRAEIMTKAIEAALPGADADERVLKVFMAPEFYWRGAYGGYVQDSLSDIVPKMRKTTDAFDYADWLFVFGTAIGYTEHYGDGGTPIKYGWQERPIEILAVDSVKTTKLHVETRNIVTTTKPEKLAKFVVDGVTAGTKPWFVAQGPKMDQIAVATADGIEKAKCFLELRAETLAPGPASLYEPLAALTDVGTGTPTVLTVEAPVCARIPFTVGVAKWTVAQGSVTGEVKTCTHVNGTAATYLLELTANVPGFGKGFLDIYEPYAVETLNVALVQKGWPAPEPDEKAMKSAAIYKEYVSAIDYLSPFHGKHDAWKKPDGSGRLITYYLATVGDVDMPMLPTEGSRDPLGAKPSVVNTITPNKYTDKKGIEHTVGSEINATGEGGGSVITLDGITFGVEICRDHLVNRLFDFYANDATAGDPKVQVLLIPSWGATIGGGKTQAITNAPVFNVDGARYDSVARVFDGKWSCDNHPTVAEGTQKGCPTCAPYKLMSCVPCGEVWYDAVKCPRCKVVTTRCYECKTCGTQHDLPPSDPAPTVCGVSGCPGTAFESTAPKRLVQMGTGFTGTTKVVDLSGTTKTWTNYFAAKRDVVIYPKKPIPKAETV
jgi:hypothetical protein